MILFSADGVICQDFADPFQLHLRTDHNFLRIGNLCVYGLLIGHNGDWGFNLLT